MYLNAWFQMVLLYWAALESLEGEVWQAEACHWGRALKVISPSGPGSLLFDLPRCKEGVAALYFHDSPAFPVLIG